MAVLDPTRSIPRMQSAFVFSLSTEYRVLGTAGGIQ